MEVITKESRRIVLVSKIILISLLLASTTIFFLAFYGSYQLYSRKDRAEVLQKLEHEVFMNKEWYQAQKKRVEKLESEIIVFKQTHELENFFTMLLSPEQMADLKDLEKHIERYRYEKEVK